jgi:hypothetical protein
MKNLYDLPGPLYRKKAAFATVNGRSEKEIHRISESSDYCAPAII